MTCHRRSILQGASAFALAATLPRAASAHTFAPKPGAWRAFEITTRLEIDASKGATQAWVPLPAVNEAEWFRSNGNRWQTAGNAKVVRDPKYGAELLHVTFDGNAPAVVEVTSAIATRDRAADLTQPGKIAALSPAERALYTGATALIPTDGIVKQTADRITAGKATDLDSARAIYDWVVENTFRNAATRGCGTGDVAGMLTSGNLGGKCADLNALFVGLARAAGIPARDIYGLRIASSKFGYRALGANSETVTRAQHCRAEVHLAGFGWVSVDPSDVRKVVLEEPPANLALNDAKVVAARNALFGSAEGTWLAYNVAHDVALPGAKGPVLDFLMYPQAEVAGVRLDCLDPDTFRYSIRARELSAA